MKGGVIEILGEGQEGIVLRPNINNTSNIDRVSKLITATPEKEAELIVFEQTLNRIDELGKFHVKMLDFRKISSENINAIPNIRENNKNGMKKYNFKITYQYGGVSIKDFLDDFKDLVNDFLDDFVDFLDNLVLIRSKKKSYSEQSK